MGKLESDFQAQLVKDIRKMFNEKCVVVKLDTDFLQGSPDLLILFNSRWAVLEVKKRRPRPSDFQPGQEYYVDLLDSWSFAAVVYPGNKDEVLHDLQRSLTAGRTARVS